MPLQRDWIKWSTVIEKELHSVVVCFTEKKNIILFCFVGHILIVQLNDRYTYYKEVITLRSMTMTGIRKNQQNLKRTYITFNILLSCLKVIFHLQISLSSHMHILRALNFFVEVLIHQTIRLLTPHTFWFL